MSYGLSWCDFIAGWSGGVLGLAVGHPLDTLKVRQQTLPGQSGIIQLAKLTYKLEGISGFFKGLAYPLLGAGIYNALFFGVYGNCLRHMQGFKGDNVRKMCCEKEPPDSTWHRDVFIAGCIAGVTTVLYSCPMDVIKIKLQAQTALLTHTVDSLDVAEPIYRGPYDAMKKIYKSYGISKGLYRGLWSMMWRDVPTFGLYTLSYEHLLCLLRARDDRSSNTSITNQVIAGGIAGSLTWILIMPIDVVKTKLQADNFAFPVYKGMLDCFKTTRRAGLKSLYAGLMVALMCAFPANAVKFVTYEHVLRLCEQFKTEKRLELCEGKKRR